jgi:glycosyltransferase involved in cell wall biosynthesis
MFRNIRSPFRRREQAALRRCVQAEPTAGGIGAPHPIRVNLRARRLTVILASLDVSIVIPAYNEARRLPATLQGWRHFLRQQSYSAELLVVDDGSRDDTADVAEPDADRVLRLGQNQGKGGAVRAGMLAATGDVRGYADADMNIDPSHLNEALMRLKNGADVVIGLRNLSEYATAERPSRLIAGGLVQLTRRTLVLRGIRDTQCGFKFFQQDVARGVFERCRIRSFAFDIEVLFVARKLGARIVEMPITTTYRAESTFTVRRHLPRFLADVVQIRRNDLAGLYR